MIGMQFTNSLNFDGFSGSVVITGPMLFNNISNYTIPGNQLSQTFIFRTWGQAKTMDTQANNRTNDPLTPNIDESENTWNDFILSNPIISWENVLFVPTTRRFLLDPAEIYKGYTCLLYTSDAADE